MCEPNSIIIIINKKLFPEKYNNVQTSACFYISPFNPMFTQSIKFKISVSNGHVEDVTDISV